LYPSAEEQIQLLSLLSSGGKEQLIDRGEKVTGGSGDENINASELRTGGFERPADHCEIPHIGDNSGNFTAGLRNRIHGRRRFPACDPTFAPCPAKIPAMRKLIPVVRPNNPKTACPQNRA
jgi:hypothetical protein